MNPLIPIILTPTLIDLGAQALESFKDSLSGSQDAVNSTNDFSQYLTQASDQDKTDLRSYLDSQDVQDATSLNDLQSSLSASLMACPEIQNWVASATQPLSLRDNGQAMEVIDAEGKTLILEADTDAAILASLTHKINQLVLMTAGNPGASIYFTASQLPNHSPEPTSILV